MNWLTVPDHDVMLASPSCTGHTPARGVDKPHHDDARATAWCVVSAAEVKRPPLVVVENVPHFMKWILYPAWAMAMEALGYVLSPHIVDAADHGVPQNRKRVFIVATQSKYPIKLKLPRRDHVAVNDFIRWDTSKWSLIDKPGRSKNTLQRVARGRATFGDRFVMPYYGSGSGLTGRSVDRPLGTVTTRDRWGIVRGKYMRMFQPSEYRAIMGFRDDYILPNDRATAIHMLGNAVPPPVACDFLNELKRAA